MGRGRWVVAAAFVAVVGCDDGSAHDAVAPDLRFDAARARLMTAIQRPPIDVGGDPASAVHDRYAEVAGILAAFDEVVRDGALPWRVRALLDQGTAVEHLADDLRSAQVSDGTAAVLRAELATRIEALECAAVDRWKRAIRLSGGEALLRGETEAARERIARRPGAAHCEPAGPDAPMAFEVASVPAPQEEPPEPVAPVAPIAPDDSPTTRIVNGPIVLPPMAATDSPDRFDRTVALGVLRAEQRRFRGCYEDAVGEGSARNGMILVHFTIDPSGAVSEAGVDVDTTGNPSVASCIVGVVRALRFTPGPTEGPVTIRYPFVFRAGE